MSMSRSATAAVAACAALHRASQLPSINRCRACHYRNINFHNTAQHCHSEVLRFEMYLLGNTELGCRSVSLLHGHVVLVCCSVRGGIRPLQGLLKLHSVWAVMVAHSAAWQSSTAALRSASSWNAQTSASCGAALETLRSSFTASPAFCRACSLWLG